jgi:hypothetical protein
MCPNVHTVPNQRLIRHTRTRAVSKQLHLGNEENI